MSEDPEDTVEEDNVFCIECGLFYATEKTDYLYCPDHEYLYQSREESLSD